MRFWRELPSRISARAVGVCRSAILLVSLINLLLLYLVFCRAYSSWVSGVAVIFTVWNIAFARVSVEAVSDPIVLLWVLVGLFASCGWLDAVRFRASGIRAWSLAFVVGGVAGLGIATKLNGVLVLVPFGVALAVVLWRSSRRERQTAIVLFQGLLAVLVSVAVAVALNPTLWPDPIGGFVAMWQHRVDRVGLQRVLSGDAYAPIWFKGIKAIRVLWDHQKGAYGIATPAIFVTVAVMGLLTRGGSPSVPADRRRQDARIVILLTACVWTAVSLLSFTQLAWPRYLYFMWPWLGLAAAVGLLRIVDAWRIRREVEQGVRRFFRAIIMSAAFFIAFWAGSINESYRAYMKRVALPPAFHITRIERALEVTPRDASLRADLVLYLAEAGDFDRALEEARRTLEIDPDNEAARWVMEHVPPGQ